MLYSNKQETAYQVGQMEEISWQGVPYNQNWPEVQRTGKRYMPTLGKVRRSHTSFESGAIVSNKSTRSPAYTQPSTPVWPEYANRGGTNREYSYSPTENRMRDYEMWELCERLEHILDHAYARGR